MGSESLHNQESANGYEGKQDHGGSRRQDSPWRHQAPPPETGLDGRSEAVERKIRLSGVAHHGDRGVWVGFRRRPAGIVYNVSNATGTVGRVEEDGQQVAEAAGRERRGNLEGALGEDIDPLVEEAVAPHPIAMEARHAGRNLECRPSVDAGG